MNMYNKYYLTSEYTTNMLKEATIIFDTSALLDLYYYSDSAQQSIFNNVFAFLTNRLWIPAQVYFEFEKNKDIVARKPIQTYKNLISKPKNGSDGGHIDKIQELSGKLDKELLLALKNQLKTLKEKTISNEKHPTLPQDCFQDFESSIEKFEDSIISFKSSIDDFAEKINSIVDSKTAIIEAELANDKIKDAIDTLFKIGPEFSYSEMTEIAQEGHFRYNEQIPPGYKDAETKEGFQKYGDLFVWKQILNYARENQKNVILITNDVKVDWFDSTQNAPRFELLKEFNEQANCFFWSFDMKTFLYNINSVLDSDSQIAEEILKEVDIIQDARNSSKFDTINYDILLQNYFGESYDIIKVVPISDSCRIFGKVKLFEAIDSDEQHWIIILNFVKGSKYSNALHPLKNAFEIRQYFTEQNLSYKYLQYTIAPTRNAAVELTHHLDRKNIKKLFNNRNIKSHIGYLSDDELSIIETNYSVG